MFITELLTSEYTLMHATVMWLGTFEYVVMRRDLFGGEGNLIFVTHCVMASKGSSTVGRRSKTPLPCATKDGGSFTLPVTRFWDELSDYHRS